MEYKVITFLLYFTVFNIILFGFVHAAPLNDKSRDEMVTELKDLKHVLSNENPEKISFSKSRTSVFIDENGKQSGFDKLKSEVVENGNLVAKLKHKMEAVKNNNHPLKSVTKTEVEIPFKGIHEVIVNSNQPQNNNLQKLEITDEKKATSNIEYSPLDMAEYIYWTGDEKSVAMMIEEFLEKGFMSRQEAINYLQSVKFNLDFLKTRDAISPKIDKKNFISPKQNAYEKPTTLLNYEKNLEDYNKLNLMEFESPMSTLFKEMSESEGTDDGIVKNRLFKQYSLEEIIYQLAKVMFSQSLSRGSVEAESVMQKLVTYLQKKVKNGQMTTNLERKLLDVLFAALTDTLTEQAESLVAKKQDLLNFIDSYSSTSDASEFTAPGSVEGSLDGSNAKKSTVEKKNGQKLSATLQSKNDEKANSEVNNVL